MRLFYLDNQKSPNNPSPELFTQLTQIPIYNEKSISFPTTDYTQLFFKKKEILSKMIFLQN